MQSSRFYFIILAVIILFSVLCSFLGYKAYKQSIETKEAFKHYVNAKNFGLIITETSDQLTTLARSFVATHDINDFKKFNYILAQRRGEVPWLDYSSISSSDDIAVADDVLQHDVPQTVTDKISKHQRSVEEWAKSIGIKGEEISLYKNAVKQSNHLALLEDSVMSVALKRIENGEPPDVKNVAVLFSERYFIEKNKILAFLNLFQSTIQNRTLNEYNIAQERAKTYIQGIILSVLIVGFLSVLSYSKVGQLKQNEQALRKHIITIEKQNEQLAEQMQKIKDKEEQVETISDDLKITEDRLIQTKKIAVLGDLISGIVHEIRNPITVITLNSKLTLDFIEKFSKNYLFRIQELSAFDFEFIENALAGGKQVIVNDSKLRRQKRRAIIKQAEENGLENLIDAELFIRNGLTLDEDFMKKIKPETFKHAQEIASDLVALREMTSNDQLASKLILKHVNGIKDYIYKRKDEPELGQLTDTINTVLTLYHSQTKMHEIELDFEPNLPKIYFNPDKIMQVWTNLLSNALDAMKTTRGTIAIKVFNADENYLGVSFSDTGEGMNIETKKRVFERMFTTKEKGVGTGIGMSLVKTILLEHHIEVSIESEVGVGTTFDFRFPKGILREIQTIS